MQKDKTNDGFYVVAVPRTFVKVNGIWEWKMVSSEEQTRTTECDVE